MAIWLDWCRTPLRLAVCLAVNLAATARPTGVQAQQVIPSHLWSKRVGDTGTDRGQSVAFDGTGNALLTGFFQGTVNLGGSDLTSAGDFDIFIAKFASDGSHLWSKRFGSTGTDRGASIAVDASGNVLVAGVFSGTVNFGGSDLISAGDLDLFIAKFASDGTHLWSKRYGSTGADAGARLAVDSSNNVFMTAHFQNTVDFGGGGLISAGGDDIVVAKFSGVDGSHTWSKRYGDTGTDQGFSVIA